jgi:CBS domain-containing protein
VIKQTVDKDKKYKGLSMTISEFLSLNVGELFLHPYEPIRDSASTGEVIDYMRERKTSCVALVNEQGASGVFSERDVCNFYEEIDRKKEIRSYMTMNPVSIPRDSLVGEALGVMLMKGFRHMLIDDGSGTITNVMSIRDIGTLLLDRMSDEDAEKFTKLIEGIIKG